MRPVFLSPHPDDAVLSCGGLLYQLAQAGQRPVVFTIFGGDRPSGAPLSDFARALQTRWQLNDDAPAARREEDRAACDRLGAMLIHLPFADAIYRVAPGTDRALYDSEEAIFGDVRDPGLIDLIAAALRAKFQPIGLSAIRCFTPLTAGHHVDHVLTRAAAERLPIELIYYEDYPYAEQPEQLARVWGEDRWDSEAIGLSEAALQAKIEAFLCHRSQLSTFYRDEAEVAQRLRAYARSTGGGPLVERYWRRKGEAYPANAVVL